MWDNLVSAEFEIDHRTGNALREAEEWHLARLAGETHRMPRWRERVASIQVRLSGFLGTALCSVRSQYAQRYGQRRMMVSPC
jgi:hypothetical protein